MKRPVIVCVVLGIVAATLCMCGKREKAVAMGGADSLSLAVIRKLMPDAESDSAKIRQVRLRYSLARQVPHRVAGADSAAVKLARRLTLLSGKDWSPEAAAMLLDAGSALATKAAAARDRQQRSALLDALAAAEESPGGKAASLTPDMGGLDTLQVADAKFFAEIFTISEEEAATLLNFMKKGPNDKMRKDAGAMVKGLLSAPETTRMPAASAGDRMITAERVEVENPALALKFRPQESIRESIEKHRADLQQIYKRQLKTNESAGGVVWLVFHVDAGGRVLSVTVKSSAINNRMFLGQLREYAATIRFKAVPTSVGNMTFEFPFEFTSES